LSAVTAVTVSLKFSRT